MIRMMTRSLIGLALAWPLLASAGDAPPASAEQEVREAVLAFNAAYERNDLDTYFSYYADGATSWLNADAVPVAGYEPEWRAFIASGGAVESNTLSGLQVKASPAGDAAVASYRLAVATRQPDGTVSRDNAQETDVWFKTDAGWRIVHLHYAYQAVENSAP